MMRANHLIGLPVICDTKKIASVLSVSVGHDGHSLSGLVVQSGLYGPRFIPCAQVVLLGDRSVLVSAPAARKPSTIRRPGRVRDTGGLRLGWATSRRSACRRSRSPSARWTTCSTAADGCRTLHSTKPVETLSCHGFHWNALNAARGGRGMRMSTFRGMAAGSVLGLAMGAGLMMMPQGRKMKRMLDKGSAQLKRQMKEMWER